VTRDELILRTRQLIAEGDRLLAVPSMTALATWLQLSDDLLAHAWGTMDRYHLAWLMVGKPKGIVRGRLMTADEEAAYVRQVVGQKTAALRMSLDAAERGMPFVGETGGVGAPRAAAASPSGPAIDDTRVPDPAPEAGANNDAVAVRHAHLAQGSRRSIPLDPELARRLEEARRAAAEHADHEPEAGAGEAATRRAPRPERLQR